MQPEIPLPITFNPHKHHFGFLQSEIKRWKSMEWEEVQSEMLCIGDNLLDFYTGKLSVKEITEACIYYFKKRNIIDQSTFENWIDPEEYRKITLNDNSEWLIKKGQNKIRFIHIHPAKHSPFSIRIKAITLKTVIALQVHKNYIQTGKNLDAVNYIRKEYLHLSPIKTLHAKKGILKLWKLFEESELLNFK